MVNVFLADGFEELEAVTVIDILKRGNVEVNLVSIKDSLEVVGAHGIKFLCNMSIDSAPEPANIFLPGGMGGTNNLKASNKVTKKITACEKTGCYLCAICAAPMVLAAAGLLENKKAICYPSLTDRLTGATIVNENVVIDGNTVTSRGCGTAAELGFTLLKLLKNEQTANRVKEEMLF